MWAIEPIIESAHGYDEFRMKTVPPKSQHSESDVPDTHYLAKLRSLSFRAVLLLIKLIPTPSTTTIPPPNGDGAGATTRRGLWS